MRRFRKPIAELDDMLPSFRRNDAKRWSKIFFYPGAVTIMLPRMIIVSSMVIMCALFSQILLIGQTMDQPIKGCRKVCVKFV